MMKKPMYVLLILAIIIPFFSAPTIVRGKTLGDIKKELNDYIKEYEDNKHQKQLTEQQIIDTRNRINSINGEIEQIGIDTIRLTNEIEELNQQIVDKDKEIKDIMNSVQISNGESAYLEYAFGAQTFTDFIYRVAVSEQLAEYNKKLIKEYNDAITANNKKKEDLANKKIELSNKQKELATTLQSLGNKISSIDEESLSIEEEIANRKKAIDLYENQLGCKDNEDIETCGKNVLPPDTAFYRPIISGYVTANFGWYQPFGVKKWHAALDMSSYGDNVPVYSSANGLVIMVAYNATCGKNIVYIQHIVNGEKYTSSYWHLRKVTVKIGDRVTKETQIGIMGGARKDNDSCSTGMHLHFTISTGLYLTDYQQHTTLNANRIDPRTLVNFPSRLYSDFVNRYTRYK